MCDEKWSHQQIDLPLIRSSCGGQWAQGVAVSHAARDLSLCKVSRLWREKSLAGSANAREWDALTVKAC